MLKDKVTVVTGSVRGIGKAIALFFAEQGAKVVINYASPQREEEARKVVEEIQTLGGEAIALCGNVAVNEEAKALIEQTVAAFGRVDVLINNAGITKDGLMLRMKEKEFDDVLAVNLKGTFNCSQYAARAMLKQGGCIINMTSVVGICGNGGQSNYAASKAGVIGLTKSMAKEFAVRGIRVNAIAPGFILTDMTGILPDKVKEQVMSQIPMKRFGKDKEVAKVAAFLASDLASYMTGEVIKVDGGMAM